MIMASKLCSSYLCYFGMGILMREKSAWGLVKPTLNSAQFQNQELHSNCNKMSGQSMIFPFVQYLTYTRFGTKCLKQKIAHWYMGCVFRTTITSIVQQSDVKKIHSSNSTRLGVLCTMYIGSSLTARAICYYHRICMIYKNILFSTSDINTYSILYTFISYRRMYVHMYMFSVLQK